MTRTHYHTSYAVRKAKKEKHLRKMANMRAAKARKRQQLVDAGLLEREPKMERWHRFQFGVRDKVTGETHFVDLKSVRHASKALGLVLKYVPLTPALSPKGASEK